MKIRSGFRRCTSKVCEVMLSLPHIQRRKGNWDLWKKIADESERGSAVKRKVGSGRPKSAGSEENVEQVAQLICSQDSKPDWSKSMRKIVKEVGICQASVRNIAKHDLVLTSFKRTPAQIGCRCRTLNFRLFSKNTYNFQTTKGYVVKFGSCVLNWLLYKCCKNHLKILTRSKVITIFIRLHFFCSLCMHLLS